MPESLTHFQTTNRIQTKFISLWIEETPGVQQRLAYCMWCRCPLFSVKGDIVTVIPGDSPASLPVTVQCRNKSCGYKWHLNLLVKKEV